MGWKPLLDVSNLGKKKSIRRRVDLPRKIEPLLLVIVIIQPRNITIIRFLLPVLRPRLRIILLLDHIQIPPRRIARRPRLARAAKVGRWRTAARDDPRRPLQRTHVRHGPRGRAANVRELPELRRRAHWHELGRDLRGARRRQPWLLTLRRRRDHRRGALIEVRRRQHGRGAGHIVGQTVCAA